MANSEYTSCIFFFFIVLINTDYLVDYVVCFHCTSKTMDGRKEIVWNISDVVFRTVRETDIPICADIEKDSYPSDEMASLTTLQYRQQNSSLYFHCATLKSNVTASTDVDANVIGFTCATRCYEFTEESMYSNHVTTAPILAIHSVVVQSSYRRKGIATAMLTNYIHSIIQENVDCIHPIKKIVLLSKSHLLGFYVNCGFQVKKPSSISHGKDLWYELEIALDEKPIQKHEGRIKCFIVDAFADPNVIGTGNPAAVVLLERLDLKAKNWVLEDLNKTAMCNEVTTWMQKVASEFNLSETAFIWSRQDPNKLEKDDNILSYNIRYFTPTVEVSLCGHATLASSSVIFQKQHQQLEKSSRSSSNTVEFHTIGDITLKANLLSINQNRTDITMSLPALESREIKSSTDSQVIVQMLSNALNMNTESILYAGIADEIDDLLLEVTYDAFMKIPYSGIDYAAFLTWKGSNRGVIISCLGRANNNDDGIDFYSRFFGPACGIDEDPVTGSAHCVLVPYYSKRLGGKRTMLACQKSKRGGLIRSFFSDDNMMVELSGNSVNAVVGHLCF